MHVIRLIMAQVHSGSVLFTVHCHDLRSGIVMACAVTVHHAMSTDKKLTRNTHYLQVVERPSFTHPCSAPHTQSRHKHTGLVLLSTYNTLCRKRRKACLCQPIT
jgi:hypothetical protein